MQPTFSIVIPIYNRAHLIGECLASVLNQTVTDFEVVLVDNNSTDDLKSALAPFNDPRIRLVYCAKRGSAAARNAGVRDANGRYISFIDSDDIWRQDVLATALPYMEKGAAVVYTRATNFSTSTNPNWTEESRQVLQLNNIGETILRGVWASCAMCALRKDLASGMEAMDEDTVVVEDIDWALRHITDGPAILLEDEPRLAYRVHETNICKSAGYELGHRQLLQKAKSGAYGLGNNQLLKRKLIWVFVSSVVNIARAGKYRAAIQLYLRVVKLAVAWRAADLLIPKEATKAWLAKK